MAEQLLPPLPYALDALEPVISKEIMDLHYNKHHKGYVTNLNKAIADYDKAFSGDDVTRMKELIDLIRFNGGGHTNHSIFWTNLLPIKDGGGVMPDGELKNQIVKQFGSVDKLVEVMTAKATAIQGSGWCWLGYNTITHLLEIRTLPNQEPLNSSGLIPLLGIDVWEHAYYLQYKNVRADYVKAIWQIINWKNVSDRYIAAKKAA